MRHPFSATETEPLTVIGLGSPFGDDQVGWWIAERLRQRVPPSIARVLIRDRPGTSVLEEIAGGPAAMLIDAAHTGAAAGTIQCLSPAEIEPRAGVWSSHDMRLGESLCLGRALGILPADLRLYLVSIDPSGAVEPTASLTPRVLTAARALTERLTTLLRGHRA